MKKTVIWLGVILILLGSTTLYAANQSSGFRLAQIYNEMMAEWHIKLDDQLNNSSQEMMTVRESTIEAGKVDLEKNMSEWNITNIQMINSEVATYHNTYMTDLKEVGEDINLADKLKVYEEKKSVQIEQEIEDGMRSFLEDILND